MSGKQTDVKPSELATCKGCGAQIIWALTPAGKPTPVDAKTTRVALLRDNDGNPPKIEDAVDGHVSHWATCPERDRFRRPKGGAK